MRFNITNGSTTNLPCLYYGVYMYAMHGDVSVYVCNSEDINRHPRNITISYSFYIYTERRFITIILFVYIQNNEYGVDDI